ncbi:MAG: class I SAM-dependent methyltransferase [Bacteroidales bacterium]
MTKKTQKFWDKQATRYDRAEQQFDAVYVDVMIKTIKYLNTTDYVLDYGCATGNKSIKLAQNVRHVHGLDISSAMIHEAIKKKNELKVSNISCSQGTIYDEGLQSASFDAVIAYGIVHLLEDKEKAILRISELLKPGGFFISTTACFKDKMDVKNRLTIEAYRFMKKLGIFPLHLNLFNTDEVKGLIGNNNFQIIEAETIFSGMTSVFIAARKLQ